MLWKFVRKDDSSLQREYIAEVTQFTEKYAAKVCLSKEVDTLLSMASVESDFDPSADDKSIVGLNRYSIGIYQTRHDYMAWLREWWLMRGVRLGADEDIETQCAFGVAEFRVHLNRAGGNVWGGVRRYNGSGTGAYLHAAKVFERRLRIFGKRHESGESVETDCPGELRNSPKKKKRRK